ncbi:MAG TPA: hypothetical protein VM261_33030 [Kofleriaceae bacterium]|nr:hypothetical protein [Kofleriaceae bacterium]
MAATATAAADPAQIDVAILDEKGAPVFCTHNATDGHGQPDGGGGYQLKGLKPGRWIVTLDLPHERVELLVTASEGETVVVPPVIARGWCRSITTTRRLDLRRLTEPSGAAWAVRYDRTYRQQRGQVATGYRFEGKVRERGRPSLDRIPE